MILTFLSIFFDFCDRDRMTCISRTIRHILDQKPISHRQKKKCHRTLISDDIFFGLHSRHMYTINNQEMVFYIHITNNGIMST